MKHPFGACRRGKARHSRAAQESNQVSIRSFFGVDYSLADLLRFLLRLLSEYAVFSGDSYECSSPVSPSERRWPSAEVAHSKVSLTSEPTPRPRHPDPHNPFTDTWVQSNPQVTLLSPST